jgi:hypothetical protein
MHVSTRLLALLLVPLLGACKIERTPREFIDRPGPGGERARVLEHQLEERFAEMASERRRGDLEAAAAALHPSPTLHVVGGHPAAGEAALRGAIARLPPDVGSPNLSGWGALPELNPTHLWFVGDFAEGGAVSGYYEREGLEWRLTLLHLTPPPE